MDELNEEQPLDFKLGSEAGGVPVLSLSGELDIATVDRLDEPMAPVLASRPQRLIVEVSDLDFADSSAIAKLLVWSQSVGEMELRGASPLLRRVVATMGLEGRLHLT